MECNVPNRMPHGWLRSTRDPDIAHKGTADYDPWSSERTPSLDRQIQQCCKLKVDRMFSVIRLKPENKIDR
jgi:hypothetical protein